LSDGQRVTQRLLAIRRRVRTFIGSASFIACAAIPCAAAQSNDHNLSDAEQWAWSRILQGLPADFNARCVDQLDPKRDNGGIASQKCRTLRAAFLENILKQPSLRDALPDNGVDVRGANIVGDVGLSFATLKHPLSITNSRFESGISLDNARAESFVDLSGSSVSGDITLEGAHIERDLNLNDAQVEKTLNANALQVDGAMHMRSDKVQSTFHDVSLIGAKVVGDLDMVGVRVDGVLNAYGLKVGGTVVFRSDVEQGRQASVSGAVTLEGAHIERDLNLNDARVEKTLNANALQVDGAMHMRSDQSQSSFHASFDDVSLIGAKVLGDVDMVGVRINGILNAHALQVGGSLVLSSGAKARQAVYGSVGSGTAIDLTSAKVVGNVDMDGVIVNGPFDAAGLKVGESLLMRSDGKYVATLRDIFLGGAKIDGGFDMTRALVAGNLNAPSAQVRGSLSMRSASFDEVVLGFARVDGNLDMTGARVTTKVDASSLQVGESLLMNSASLGDLVGLGDAKIHGLLDLADASAERLDAPSLRVEENLDLRGARISRVNLGDAVVGGYIKVGAKDDEPTIKELDLHNARAGSLLDNGEKSWPTKMRLDGFTFSRFGESTMAKRDRAWWDNWAHSDESKSSYPYEQLAVAHAAAGDRNAADAFHYAERVRAAENADWGERALSYVLGWGAGYGIGYYMFRALGWALLLAVIGTLVLRFFVKGVRDETGRVTHGSFWCFGASVDRLLPFITLKKEFSEFFDDKEVNRFTRGQDLFFIVFGVLGWVLGAIVLAAMGTFTKGS
jgi:hypothetical protein